MKGDRPGRPAHPSLGEPLWGLIQKCWEAAPNDRPEIGDVITELKRMSVYSLLVRLTSCLPFFQNTRESIPPPKKLPEEPHVPIQGSSPIVGSDMETPSPRPTPPTPKVEERGSPAPFLVGESRIDLRRDSRSPLAVRSPTFLVYWSKANLLADNPLASGSRATLEEGREPHVPPKGVKEDNNRKEPEVGF